MPLKHYGVLKARVVGGEMERDADSPHYQIHALAGEDHYRIAINVKSALSPSELLYLVDEDFDHPVSADLKGVPVGFSPVRRDPGGIAVDFIRGNFFDPTRMKALPHNVPGLDNDLNEKIDAIVKRAAAAEDTELYVFGEPWGPENMPDKIFGFSPGRGMHDVHMNQGNSGRFVADNGVWQDGAMFIHFPGREQWVSVFMAFQSQCWHTNDIDGACLVAPGPVPGPSPMPGGEPQSFDGVVRIAAALVNPVGGHPEVETVSLINISPRTIDLAGWMIADKHKNKFRLSGTIGPGTTKLFMLPQEVQLGNKGGIITLLNESGLKVHGVSYTRQQALREGWTIVF